MLSIPYAAGEALTIKNTKEKVVQMVSPSLSPWAPPCPLCKIPAYLYLMWLLSRCWCDTKSKHPEQSCCGRWSTLLSWIISQHRMRLSSALKPWTLGLRKHVLTFCIRSLITSVFYFSQPSRCGARGAWLRGPPAPTSGLPCTSATAHAQLADGRLSGLRWETVLSHPASGQEAKSPSSKAHLVKPLRQGPQQVSKARLHWLPGIVSFPFPSLSLLDLPAWITSLSYTRSNPCLGLCFKRKARLSIYKRRKFRQNFVIQVCKTDHTVK